MAEHDDPRDPRVSGAYRGLAKENPPEAIDAAILAASRRAVGARPRAAGTGMRRWALPVSIAAVVVLTVSLVVRVQLERPDLESPLPAANAPAPQPATADEKDAPRVMREEAKGEVAALAKRKNAGADARAKSRSSADAPTVASGPKESERASIARQTATAPAAALKTPPAEMRPAPARATPKKPAFVPEPPASEAAPSESVAAPALGAARPDDDSGLARGRAAPAQGVESAGRVQSPMALEDRISPAAETVGKRDADLAPQDWLERIARLRRDGRAQEADDSLAAFRKRYPDYEIPKEMRDAVLGEAARAK